MLLKITPGTYYAGFSRPFFVSDAMVREGIEELGGRNVRFFEATKKPPVNPKLDRDYDSGWDEWLSVEYKGPEKIVDEDRQWSWLVRKPYPKPSSETLPNSELEESAEEYDMSSMALGLVLFEVAFWLFLIGRKK